MNSRVVASAAVVAVSALFSGAASAQVVPGDTNAFCSFADITNATVTACTGFWDKNLLNTGAPGPTDADETAALNALLGQSLSGYSVIQNIADTGGAPVNFTQMLYGMTVIGVHFGNGADRFKDMEDPEYDGNGGTAFYLFNAGTAGLDTIIFSSDLAKASSGATLYKTDEFTPPPIPEPSTYALMLAGLGAVGLMARRRARKQ